MKKSLGKNAIFSGGQKLLSIIFPLITFPYISRVLLVEDIGKINFSTSIISYFMLIAALGINNYATREGAKIRDNPNELERFANQMFSINIITTIIAYILLIVVGAIFSNLRNYALLLTIESFTIIGTTMGVNWIYSIYEDYKYIAIRTLIMQVVSLILMFIFVRNESNYVIYAIITVVSAVGANVFNFIHSRKYIKLKLTKNVEIKKHIKPILIIFSSAIAVTIYVSSDTTILGIICGEYYVGLYSRAVRIYTIIKQMVASMVVVALPRLSNEIGKENIEQFKIKLNEILKNVLMMILPVGIGLCLTSKDIMLIIAGSKYEAATTSLAILGISSIFAVLSSYMTYCCLLPLRLEKVQMIATYIGALANVVGNCIILPILYQNGAALTTMVSEFLVLIIEFLYLRRKKKKILTICFMDFMVLMLGIISIVMINYIISILKFNMVIDLVLKIILSSVSYFSILSIFKFDSFIKIRNKIIKKFGIVKSC